jgi:hypothetical protein
LRMEATEREREVLFFTPPFGSYSQVIKAGHKPKPEIEMRSHVFSRHSCVCTILHARVTKEEAIHRRPRHTHHTLSSPLSATRPREGAETYPTRESATSCRFIPREKKRGNTHRRLSRFHVTVEKSWGSCVAWRRRYASVGQRCSTEGSTARPPRSRWRWRPRARPLVGWHFSPRYFAIRKHGQIDDSRYGTVP